MNAAVDTPVSTPEEPKPRAAWRTRLRRIGILAAAVWLGVATLGRRLTRSDADGFVAVDEVAGQRVVAAFLAAPDAAARGDLVLASEAERQALSEWLPVHAADTPAAAQFVRAPFSAIGADGTGVALMAPRDRGLPPVVALLRPENGRLRLDFAIWRQSSDAAFRQFVQSPTPAAATFRVALTLDEKNSDGLQVRLEDPFDPAAVLHVKSQRPDLYAAVCGAMATGATRHATVEIAWLNDSRAGGLRPELRRVVCWGFLGFDTREPLEMPEADSMTAWQAAHAAGMTLPTHVDHAIRKAADLAATPPSATVKRPRQPVVRRTPVQAAAR